jgi:hypothetical protein
VIIIGAAVGAAWEAGVLQRVTGGESGQSFWSRGFVRDTLAPVLGGEGIT